MTQTVLVADDEAMVANVAKAFLEHAGYEVLVAKDGHETLQLFQTNQDQVSVLMIDYSMPDMDGLACIQEIRKTSKVPAILITGYGDSVPEGCKEAGLFQAFLAKPFNMKTLEEALQKVI